MLHAIAVFEVFKKLSEKKLLEATFCNQSTNIVDFTILVLKNSFGFPAVMINKHIIIYTLGTFFRIEEANYDGSCRRIITALYGRAPRSLTFYNNTLYWGDISTYNGAYRIWQTNRTTGDTTVLDNAAIAIVDTGVAKDRRNGN